jgi:uncharacterized protein YneF (UPF0154 family)
MTDGVENNPVQRGMPVWVPLLGLLVALLLAIYVGIKVAPTLVGMVLPPEPPIPADQVTLVEQKNLGPGSDEWLYTSDLTGCEVARYVDERVGDCFFFGNSGCDPNRQAAINPNSSYRVAECNPVQKVGEYSVRWSITISANMPAPQPPTAIRIWRDVTNLEQ